MSAGTVKMSPKLRRVFRRLTGRGLSKHSRAACTKAVRIIAKGIKSKITKPTMKSLKRAIGFKVKQRQGVVEAKAGSAVGKKMTPGAGTTGNKRAGRKGVGIGPPNTHWFLRGTAKRWTGYKTTRRKIGRIRSNIRIATGGKIRYTGKMPSQAPGAVQAGFAATSASAQRVLETALWKGIVSETK